MTKLEQKLIELGYEKFHKYCYKKEYGIKFTIFIRLVENNRNKINDNWISINMLQPIEFQQDIDNLQQAFNLMQKDLEELRMYERKNIMYSFGFKRGNFPKIEMNNLENDYIAKITEKILVEKVQKVNEVILKSLYETNLEFTDIDTQLVIDKSEFEKFLLKYLPIYLEELKKYES